MSLFSSLVANYLIPSIHRVAGRSGQPPAIRPHLSLQMANRPKALVLRVVLLLLLFILNLLLALLHLLHDLLRSAGRAAGRKARANLWRRRLLRRRRFFGIGIVVVAVGLCATHGRC